MKDGVVDLALLVGSFPTISMILVSALLYNLKVGPVVEACFQNFAAGLIIAAVAAELFPLMLVETDELKIQNLDTWIGVTIGMVIGVSVINGIEWVVDFIKEYLESKGDVRVLSTPNEDVKNSLVHNVLQSGTELVTTPRKEKTKVIDENGDDIESGSPTSSQGEWVEGALSLAERSLQLKSHRAHIEEHLQEIVDEVNSIEKKSIELLDDSLDKSKHEAEQLAESIDEAVHMLQYKIDHCRRLLEGSESGIHKTERSAIWISDEEKESLRKGLKALKYTSDHLLDHIKEDTIDSYVIQEMHEHLVDMDKHIEMFHAGVSDVTSKWKKKELFMPEEGATLPFSLIIPVTLDCIVDGFLIGVSVALNPKAGYILSAANCLEMGFLGMAYSTRLAKCTGSSSINRQLALFLPPFLMLLSAGLGGWLGDLSRSYPTIFVSFVAFGVVALIALAVCELVIEAHGSNEDEIWWVRAFIFLGVYMVLMLHPVL